MAETSLNGQSRSAAIKAAADRGAEPVSGPSASNEQSEQNSIRPTKRRAQTVSNQARIDPNAGNTDSAAKKPRDRGREIPEDVRKRFTQVGNRFYFPDGTRAFTDRGSRIVSSSENTEVIKSLITIAQARGWTDLTVSGTERFRREAWFIARQEGLEVRGYKPSVYEEGRVARAVARGVEPRAAEPGLDRDSVAPSRRVPERDDDSRIPDGGPRQVSRQSRRSFHTGRLADHGAAPYRHDSKNAISYFIRLETDDGEREIWGVDLHRALKESLTRPQIGDEVGLRAVRRDTVTLREARRDEDDQIVGNRPLTTHRNRWIVEQREFFAERAHAARVVLDPSVAPKAAVQEHPELAGTFLKIRASELAAQAIRDPEDRQRFVATVRKALADEISRGEPLTPVRLNERAERQIDPRVAQRDQVPVR